MRTEEGAFVNAWRSTASRSTETTPGGNGGPSGQFVQTDVASFSLATAKAVGKHRATVDRAAPRGEALGDDLRGFRWTLQNNTGKMVEKVGESMPPRWRLI
jgi:hypothetical protein